jgi:Protein of unknown function (DUF1194)
VLIDGPQTAQQFSDRLLELPRSTVGLTSISSAIDFAAAQFVRAPHEAQRRIIDISGDGINNGGRNPMLARDETRAQGITINGLVILTGQPLPGNPEHQNPSDGLANYYRTNVIGGPGAFVMETNDFNSFGQAIVNKLITEIAEASPPPNY